MLWLWTTFRIVGNRISGGTRDRTSFALLSSVSKAKLCFYHMYLLARQWKSRLPINQYLHATQNPGARSTSSGGRRNWWDSPSTPGTPSRASHFDTALWTFHTSNGRSPAAGAIHYMYKIPNAKISPIEQNGGHLTVRGRWEVRSRAAEA